ncbi:PfkB family carbohydrate kinase [Pelagibacterium mangrovi]|uniref:PfkB family carbohydrate kinase n=1 Tax=Pelagibacterium mangrovi TaxID=3119828 RepID=UPI002FCBB411
MSKPVHIVFAGAATVDMIFKVDALSPGPGKILPKALVQVAHGMATSAATAAARLGGRCALITRIGDDMTGTRFLEDVQAEGVDCTMVRRFAGVATPLSAVIVDDDGERLIVPYYDPALGSDPDWIDAQTIAGADAVQVDIRWPQGAARVLDLAREAGKIALLDADVGPTEIIVDLAQRATHTVFSEPAALAVSRGTSIPEAVEVLARRFEGFVAVTAGAQGCFWHEDGKMFHRPAPKVEAVDTLAAGDVFHGAFTLALAEGQPIAEAVAFANTAAAISCTVFGGRLGAPDRAAVEALMAVTDAPVGIAQY